jgi:hypothetical protein
LCPGEFASSIVVAARTPLKVTSSFLSRRSLVKP